jgi:hypothetical protein
MSLPIAAAKFSCKGLEELLGNRNSSFFNWENVQSNSQVYRNREKLREKLDTEPGVKFLQSNIIGAVPFVLIGMPAAEGAQYLLNNYFPYMSEFGKFLTNSFSTLTAQVIVGYSAFMANEVRTNKQKYTGENGKLNAGKITSGLVKAAKAFLSFDIPYFAGKISLQTLFLLKGKNPWKASGIADMIAAPLWYTVGIGMGLHNGIIETNDTNNIKNN